MQQDCPILSPGFDPTFPSFVHCVITLHLVLACTYHLWIACKGKVGQAQLSLMCTVLQLVVSPLRGILNVFVLCFCIVLAIIFYHLISFCCQSSLLSNIFVSLSWSQVSLYLQCAWYGSMIVMHSTQLGLKWAMQIRCSHPLVETS